ncbi:MULTISPECIES: hypothetical protein [unclassified Modestobacter]
MKTVLAVVAVLAMLAAGIVGMVLGEGDDSPGLQGLGGLLTLGAVALGIRATRRGKPQASQGH